MVIQQQSTHTNDKGEGTSQLRHHAFVSFPGAPYTHASILRAAQSTLPPHQWTIHHRSHHGTTDEDTSKWIEEQQPHRGSESTTTLYLMDYDLIPFDSIHPSRDNSKATSASSYPIRKALIRKNWLYSSIRSHSIKTTSSSSLSENNKQSLSYLPKTWSVDIQFADDLDELLIDELYDLKESFDEAQEKGERKWFILKAGMADRGMGIRMFDSLDALRDILEQWEGDDDSNDGDGDGDGGSEREEAQEDGDTGVLLGQLRHFVIQEYISPPLLIAPNLTQPHCHRKFHLRAYVLCIGGLQVYLWQEMLALFAPSPYQNPSEDADAKIHLTNTCLHSDGSSTIDGRAAEENVHLLSDLCMDGRMYCKEGGEEVKLTVEDLSRLRNLAKETIGATFEAAAKGSGSTNWLMWEGCWEVFGVDLMVSWQGDEWRMWLLEVNAQPDFAQSGPRLQRTIDALFESSLRLAVLHGASDEEPGMSLCFEGKMRGQW